VAILKNYPHDTPYDDNGELRDDFVRLCVENAVTGLTAAEKFDLKPEEVGLIFTTFAACMLSSIAENAPEAIGPDGRLRKITPEILFEEAFLPGVQDMLLRLRNSHPAKKKH